MDHQRRWMMCYLWLALLRIARLESTWILGVPVCAIPISKALITCARGSCLVEGAIHLHRGHKPNRQGGLTGCNQPEQSATCAVHFQVTFLAVSTAEYIG
jgi:hypothetical protein